MHGQNHIKEEEYLYRSRTNNHQKIDLNQRVSCSNIYPWK